MELNDLVVKFYEEKQIADKLSKNVSKMNNEIKEIMYDFNLDLVDAGNGIKAKRTVSERTSFIEEALLEKAREYNIPGLIKTTEYVDMEVLESALYNGLINPEDLSDCQQVKEVVSLRVTSS